MNTETKRIHALLQSSYQRKAWHGPSVRETLQDVTAVQAQQRIIPASHTIWELVLHMTSWRKFTWNKLSGDQAYDILTPEQDWPVAADTSDGAWQMCLQALAQSQQDLLQAIEKMNDGKLEVRVPGRDYSFYVLLHGIIQHDLYHTGQMAILKKNVNK